MEIKVITNFNKDIIEQSIINDQYPVYNQAYEVIKLKEQGVIDALIALGWTPPKELNRVNNMSGKEFDILAWFKQQEESCYLALFEGEEDGDPDVVQFDGDMTKKYAIAFAKHFNLTAEDL